MRAKRADQTSKVYVSGMSRVHTNVWELEGHRLHAVVCVTNSSESLKNVIDLVLSRRHPRIALPHGVATHVFTNFSELGSTAEQESFLFCRQHDRAILVTVDATTIVDPGANKGLSLSSLLANADAIITGDRTSYYIVKGRLSSIQELEKSEEVPWDVSVPNMLVLPHYS